MKQRQIPKRALLLVSIIGGLGCQNPSHGDNGEAEWVALESACEALWAEEARALYDVCRDEGQPSELCQDQALELYEDGVRDNCRPCEAGCALEGRLEFERCQIEEASSEICGVLSFEAYQTCNASCDPADPM